MKVGERTGGPGAENGSEGRVSVCGLGVGGGEGGKDCRGGG